MVASKDAKGKPLAKPAGKGGKDEKSTDESVKLFVFTIRKSSFYWHLIF
jgi:hypothetical protein